MKKANKAHKPNIHEEYLQYHKKYQEKYGSKANKTNRKHV